MQSLCNYKIICTRKNLFACRDELIQSIPNRIQPCMYFSINLDTAKQCYNLITILYNTVCMIDLRQKWSVESTVSYFEHILGRSRAKPSFYNNRKKCAQIAIIPIIMLAPQRNGTPIRMGNFWNLVRSQLWLSRRNNKHFLFHLPLHQTKVAMVSTIIIKVDFCFRLCLSMQLTRK